MAAPTREEILSDLKGQHVRIPDLESLYINWPFIVNNEQEAVRSVVQHILETYSMTQAVEMKLKRANLPLLIASWYPFSSAETLKELTYFVCWMYMVDDAIIDKVSWPGLDNAGAFEAAYNELMGFVYKSLKLDGNMEQPQPKSDIAAIDSFRLTGETLCQKYTLAQRQKFYDSCKFTMEGYRTEQQLRVAGQIPTWEEYWTYREGSSCISMCVALIELATDSDLSNEILESHELQLLWTETVILAWVMNDILSVKKELGDGFIENAVALSAIETRDAQIGMERVIQIIKESIRRFDEQAAAVEKRFHNQAASKPVQRFVESCRCMVTGSLSWSLISPRYGLFQLPKDPDGGIIFVIGT